MQIAILDDYQGASRRLPCFSLLAGHAVDVINETFTDPAGLAARIGDAEALVLIRERTRISTELLDRLPKLKLISQTGRLSGHIDVAACTARGVAIAEGVGSPIAPAELTWALIMAARRFVPQEAARLKSGGWQMTVGYQLAGATLGVWSYGKIGRIIAGYGRAFGMNVVVWGREASLAAAAADGYRAAASREALFAESDVLSLHLRLNDATRGIVGAADLARMKSDALFVNTSRAELVAPNALVDALAAGRPGYAAVDVFEEEPVLNAAHPLLKFDNVVATPHLGYVEWQSYEKYFRAAFENVVAYANGTPTNLANPEVVRT